jgi:hypothetical protein
MPTSSPITRSVAPHGPIEIVAAAQIDQYRAIAAEDAQQHAQEAEKAKRKLFKTIPFFVLSAGLVAIIPASVGAASGMGMLNTAANFGAAWMLSSMVAGAVHLRNSRKAGKRAQNTAHATDLNVAAAIREATDIDALKRKRTSSLKKSFIANVVVLSALMVGGVSATTSSTNAIETILGVFFVGVSVLGGGIILPGIREKIRNPASDPVIRKAKILRLSLQALEAEAAVNALHKKFVDELQVLSQREDGEKQDDIRSNYRNVNVAHPAEDKASTTRAADDNPTAPPRGPKI